MVRDRVRVDALERSRELRGEDEADRDRLAVQERVARRRLERVRERVPVVQHRPRARRLELVRGDVAPP